MCVSVYTHIHAHAHICVFHLYFYIYIRIYISRKPLSHNIISNPIQNTIGFTHFLLFSEQPGPTYSFDQFLWMYPISHKLSPPILIWMPTSLRLGCQCCSVNRLPSSSCLVFDAPSRLTYSPCNEMASARKPSHPSQAPALSWLSSDTNALLALAACARPTWSRGCLPRLSQPPPRCSGPLALPLPARTPPLSASHYDFVNCLRGGGERRKSLMMHCVGLQLCNHSILVSAEYLVAQW